MLYTPWMVISEEDGIKKISFENFNFSAALGEKLQKQVVYQSLGTPAPRTQYHNKMTTT